MENLGNAKGVVLPNSQSGSDENSRGVGPLQNLPVGVLWIFFQSIQQKKVQLYLIMNSLSYSVHR